MSLVEVVGLALRSLVPGLRWYSNTGELLHLGILVGVWLVVADIRCSELVLAS